jgi:hypothetical protein
MARYLASEALRGRLRRGREPVRHSSYAPSSTLAHHTYTTSVQVACSYSFDERRVDVLRTGLLALQPSSGGANAPTLIGAPNFNADAKQRCAPSKWPGAGPGLVMRPT